jgi:PAS domain S-box-containing protein
VWRPEVWIPVAYGVVAGGWIALSDSLLAGAARSVGEQAAWSILKGFGFVAATSVALHAGLRWALARERSARRLAETCEAARRESEERDLAERKRATEALRESEEKRALAIEAADMGTWHAVPFGPMECSPRFREIFGIADGLAIDGFETFLRLVHPDDREKHRSAVLRSLDPSGEGTYEDQYRCVLPDGSVRWISARGKVRFADVNGVRQAGRAAGVVLDVTERKAMQAQLMQSDRLASVGMLAAGVAHEINNPLAYLIAALDFLDGECKEFAQKLPGVPSTELREALAEAREGAARVKHVVRDLKTFSRADEERRVQVELRPVIESTLNMVFNEIKYRARLVKEYGKTPPVLANEARLGQVFLNLLVNAAHAISEGRVDENEIRVATKTDDLGRAIVEVCDSGSGIPPDVLKHVFDPFFTTKPTGIGTGLGLSICHSIVTALGGEISVESQVNEGTVFRVVLPAAPPLTGDHAGAEPALMTPSVAQRPRGRVLVVDDEPAICAALKRVLAPEHEVVVLTSALEAQDRIARGERFDVILCDLMMPKMTGMELHAELTSLAPEQAARMVLLTGGAFTPLASEFLNKVPNARVEKPFDAASLRALIRGLVA